MGNEPKRQRIRRPQIENPDLAKEEEKEKVLKGTYEERYKLEKKDPINFYDLIIDINTFSQKPNIIWNFEKKPEFKNKPLQENNKEVRINDEENKEEEKFEVIDAQGDIINDKENNDKNDKIEKNSNDKTVVGILGLGNVGKSYILSLFTGEELPIGDSIHTKGISVKGKDNLIILDSVGIEAPLTKKTISEKLYPKEDLLNKNINESDSLIETIARDKKAVELFIQDFIIEKSDILVIVVGQLTLTEQKLINRISNSTNKKDLYVIHNLKDLYSKEQIEEYIKNIFKKNIFFKEQNLKELNYKEKPSLFGKEYEYDKYFFEKYKNSDNTEKQVLHFIMGSNVKDSEAYFFNKTVFDFFQKEISNFNGGKKFNIFEELKDFIVKNGKKYIESSERNENPFQTKDIKIEIDGDKGQITIKNENNNIKKCIMNQLGYSHFYGSLFSPNYICYVEENKEKKEKKLMIDINAPGKELFKFDNPKTEEIFEEGHKIKISFTGSKELKNYNEPELSFSNMNSGNFRIDILLDCNECRLKEGEKVIRKKLKGVVRFIFALMTNEDFKDITEMKAINVSKNEKIKEKEEGKEANKKNK